MIVLSSGFIVIYQSPKAKGIVVLNAIPIKVALVPNVCTRKPKVIGAIKEAKENDMDVANSRPVDRR